MSLLLSLMLAQSAGIALEAEEGQLRPKVLVLNLVNSTELDPDAIEALQDAILGGLQGAPVEIMGAADIAKLMEVQQGSVTLGCLRDDCLFDLAKAWQARYVISGSLAMVAKRAVLNLKLLDAGAESPKVLHRESHEAEPAALTALIRVTAARMREALGGPGPTEKELEVLKVARLPLVALSAGLVALGGGAWALQQQVAAAAAAQRAIDQQQDSLAVDHHLDLSEGYASGRNLALGLSVAAAAFSALAWSKSW